MARRRAIEADELFETANRLQAEGKEVTATGLLDALGGGSLRTIYKYLEDWQRRRPAAVITTEEEIPPAVLLDFHKAWRSARQEAGLAVLAVKEKAAEEVAEALKQFHGALEYADRLEKEAEEAAQLIDGSKVKVAELEGLLQKSQTEGAAALATSEQLKQQVKSQEAELERLHKDVDKERSGWQHEIQRITEAAGAAQEKAGQQIESLKSTIGEVQGKVQQLENERSDAQSRRDETQKQLEKIEEASKADRAERDTAIKEAAQLRGLSEGLKTQNAELLSKLGRDNKQDRKG